VAHAVETVRPLIDQRRRTQADIATKPDLAFADARLEQMLVNLLPTLVPKCIPG
jgi:C4-dicarboxylate-specific signal transduction histidine kinase